LPIRTDPNFIPSRAASVQERLWGADPGGWSQFGEPRNRALFEEILDIAHLSAGTRLLDIGCGSGMLVSLAQSRGARVSGVDVAMSLLTIAAERVPAADLRRADIEALPFEDESFDVCTAVNAFQFATDPRIAIREAARVLVPGGRLFIGMFAEPEKSESTVVQIAMGSLLPPAGEADHAPYSLSATGALDEALSSAGLVFEASEEVVCVWAHATVDQAVRAMLGSGGGAQAVEVAGHEAVRATIERALSAFVDHASAVAMRNTFRWISARKGAE
jgi:SAM-dependent methyltransferase